MSSRRLLPLAAVLALLVAGCGSDQPATESAAPADWQSRVTETTGLSQEHVEGTVKYPSLPPVGGAHSAKWQNCGFFTTPVVDVHAVHSLEHGAVWFTWKNSLSASERSFIKELVDGTDFLLASPYPEQDAAFTLTAWGLQLKLDSFEREAITGFVSTYANGPQNPEPGAPCMNGINTSR